MLPALNLPQTALKLTRKNEQLRLQCLLRKTALKWTPEEWVRQHLIALFLDCGAPIGRMKLEQVVVYNNHSLRADILVYDAYAQPLLVVECKAPQIALDEKVLFQWSKYQRHLNAPYFMISNGLEHWLGEKEQQFHPTAQSLQELTFQLKRIFEG